MSASIGRTNWVTRWDCGAVDNTMLNEVQQAYFRLSLGAFRVRRQLYCLVKMTNERQVQINLRRALVRSKMTVCVT